MTSLFDFGAVLLLLAAMLWLVLRQLRGGVSTGTSKRAAVFVLLVYTQILTGVAGYPFSSGLVESTFQSGPFALVHLIGAGVVAFGAFWVWSEAKGMQGFARTSANLIGVLTMVLLALGLALHFSPASAWGAIHKIFATALLGAAVWHAYEMRIYPLPLV